LPSSPGQAAASGPRSHDGSPISATVDAFGRLDILVPNPGVGAYGPCVELAPDFVEEMIDINVKRTLYAVRAALPHLLESGEAGIVTLAGMMSADDVADVVLFVLTRPRNHRILETAFRPMTEASWG